MNGLLYLNLNTLIAPSSWSLFFLKSTTTNLKRTRQQNSFSRFSTVSFFNFQGFQGPFQNSRLFQGFQGFQGPAATLSFSQDLVYVITNGRVKTPKSILHPYHIKSLTNNIELINITCHLGDGISFSLIGELSTEIAY